jgi:hypothetical protein
VSAWSLGMQFGENQVRVYGASKGSATREDSGHA